MTGTNTYIKIAAVIAVLSMFTFLSSCACNSEESDAGVIIEGDLTPTAKFRLTDDYTLYFEGTGEVSTYCFPWLDYVGDIRSIYISNGITNMDCQDIDFYTSLETVYAGRDMSELYIYMEIEELIFFDGCGDMESLTVLFKDGVLFLYAEELSLFKDRYTEIYLRLVPNSEIPDEVKDFVRYDRVYELYITGVDMLPGEGVARVIYGYSEIPITVYHLLPTYELESEVDYYCTFDVEQTGYYVLHIDNRPLIPNAPEIALMMIAVFSIIALFYYLRVVRVKQ